MSRRSERILGGMICLSMVLSGLPNALNLMHEWSVIDMLVLISCVVVFAISAYRALRKHPEPESESESAPPKRGQRTSTPPR